MEKEKNNDISQRGVIGLVVGILVIAGILLADMALAAGINLVSYSPISGTNNDLSYSQTPSVGCNGVPLLKQCGSSFSSHNYGCGGTTICSSGCGVVSAVMVLQSYGVNINPEEIADLSLQNGYRVCNAGTSADLFSFLAKKYNFKSRVEISWGEAKKYLLQGKPVIGRMRGPSPFNKSRGHYVVFTCVNSDRTITVNNPGKNQTSATESNVIKYGKGFSVIY